MDKFIDFVESVSDFLTGAPMDIFSKILGSTVKTLLNGPAEAIMQTNAPILATLYTAVIPVALMLMLIAFATKVMEMGIDQQFSIEKFVKDFILLIFVLMILDNGVNASATGWIQKGYDYVIEISDSIISDTTLDSVLSGDAIENAFELKTEDDPDERSIFQKIKDIVVDAIWGAVMKFLTTMIMVVLSSVIMLFIFGVALYRAVKIGIYVVLAPIGVASCYTKGASGLIYFKKLLALVLQYPLILLSNYIILKALNDTMNPFMALVATGLIISTALSSESKAKELLR